MSVGILLTIGLAMYAIYSLDRAYRDKKAGREAEFLVQREKFIDELRRNNPVWQEAQEDIENELGLGRKQDCLTIVDSPHPDESLPVWKDHLKELEAVSPEARDFLLLQGIRYAQEVIQRKESGEIP